MPTSSEGAMSVRSQRRVHWAAAILATTVLGLSAGEPTSSAAEFEFGIRSVSGSVSTGSAAAHADLTTNFELSQPISVSSARTKDIRIDLPPGLIGNPRAVPACTTGDFEGAQCPVDSQVGLSKVIFDHEGVKEIWTFPFYSLQPPHPGEEVARFGFLAASLPVFVDVSVRTAGDYGVSATVHDAPGLKSITGAETIIWADPADPSHNRYRLLPTEVSECEDGVACKAPGEERESGIPPAERKPFLTNPSACGPLEVGFSVTSYQLPGQVFSANAPLEGPAGTPAPIYGCQGLPFAPTFEATPTSRRAGAPTGLETVLKLPQTSDPTQPGTATMREARVTLPEGMTVAAGAANGIGACSEAQVHLHEEVDQQCPDDSKLGTAKIISPVLSQPLEGALYQRTPEPGHLFRLWLVTDQLGLHVKLPGEIHPDPQTGQLTAVFSDLPPVPVEEIDLDVFGGDNAPLKNPDSCGTFQTSFSFAPASNDPAVTGQAPMTIDEGCGARGFDPKIAGGVTDAQAGAFSPFVFDLTREDGEQDLKGFSLTLPEGELAKLAGVPLCPDSAAGDGSCPAGSKIGSVTAAAGPGPDPLWLPQPGRSPTAVYLAGPYKGAPYSIVSVVPAQAGPFDLGNVVARSALEIDPRSAVASVVTEPLPQIVEGVPVSYRRLHVVIDRPGFTLNPTSCAEMAISSSLVSTQGTLAHPSIPFGLVGCRALGFKPTLKLRLKGSTQRGKDPALRAVLTYPAKGAYANVSKVSTVLPRSEFIDSRHVTSPCTRVQFAVGKVPGEGCPKKSILGHAKAWTPLLDAPLEGPVYFRSNGGERELPDLVVALHGAIDVQLVGFIDSVGKKGSEVRPTRTIFEGVPDAPVSRFVLSLQGGKKGLLQNSTNLCKVSNRAVVKMDAQNGRVHDTTPLIATGCPKGKGKARGGGHGKHHKAKGKPRPR
jgi:hypothetical protein